MRKTILVIFTCLCLMAGAALAEATPAPDFAPISFTFWSDAAAGYEWSCEYQQDGCLEAPFEEMTDVADGGAEVCFSFGVHGPGTARLIFNYGVNFGMSVPERIALCSVTVDEKGRPSVRWAERYAGDNMLVIRLPSNPTSGFDWDYVGDSAGTITLVEEEYQPYDPYLEGAGGVTVYNLRVEKPGETILLFNYGDMWNPEAAAKETYAVFVNANESMEISLTVDDE